MSNWFNDLKKISEEDKIIAIATEKGLFNSVEEAKETLDYDFDGGYGSANGPRFTAWSEKRIYFPVEYDDSEWIESVPRNPSKEATYHLGG